MEVGGGTPAGAQCGHSRLVGQGMQLHQEQSQALPPTILSDCFSPQESTAALQRLGRHCRQPQTCPVVPQFPLCNGKCSRTHQWQCESHDFPALQATFHKIHWQVLQPAVQQLSTGVCSWHWKLILGCSGVRSQLFRHQHHKAITHPLRSAPCEKASHVLSWPNAEAAGLAAVPLSSTVQGHLQESDAHPGMLLSIPKLFGQARQDSRLINFSTHPRSIQLALRAQAVIVWAVFLIGCWSVEWLRLQQRHQHFPGQDRTPQRQTSALH